MGQAGCVVMSNRWWASILLFYGTANFSIPVVKPQAWWVKSLLCCPMGSTTILTKLMELDKVLLKFV